MRRKPAASEGWGSDADPDSGSSGNGGGGGGGGSRGGDSPPSSPSTPSSPSPQPLLPTLPSPQAFVEAYTGYEEQGAWDLHSMSLELELAPFQELEWIRYQEAQEDWRRSYDNKSDSCKLRDKATSDDRSKSGDNKYDSCKTRDKKPIMDLADEFENNTIKKKITLLSKKYDFFRPVDRDGSCFYRAFIFSYMERIVAMQDDLERIIEVSRIGERVGKYKQAYARFGSFGIPQEEFLKALSAFEQLINLIEKGFVTEIEICTHEDQYKDFLLTADCASVFEFCQVEVRPENAEASQQQMKALAEALGIPVLVENLDTTSKENETPELNQHFIYPRPESEEGTMLGPLNLHEIVSPESSGYHAARGELQNQPGTSGSSTNSSTEALGLQSIGTSSTPNERDGNGDMTINDLSPAERRRLATLLYRPGHYDILCPKSVVIPDEHNREAQEDWRKSDDNKSDSCKQKDKEQGAWDLHSMSLELELAPFQELEWIRYQEAQEDWRRSYDNKSDSCKLRDKATSDDRSKSGDNKYDSCKTRDKKPIMDLADEFENNTIKKKITLLSKKYDFFRPVDRDGSCFYRAFIFSYMERIVAMQDDLERIIEVSRIGERVGKYKQAYARFGSFGIPQEEFLKALSAFEQLINLIEKGFVTEIEICTHEDQYKDFLLTADCASVFEFCQVEVRPENAEASQQQMKALAEALGIPVLVENLDTTSKENETPELNQHFIYPRPESEEGTMLGPLNLHEIVSPESSGYHAARGELQNQPGTSGSSTNSSTEALGLQSIGTSSTPNERDGNGDMTINDLSPAERRRLATLLYRPGHYDILCPK
uniref:ubiquitinyl hydrolase 1 n=1 Tax=Oryza meridionalis TaxID=40149 RepID=A0A0E0DJA0_9ORYZ